MTEKMTLDEARMFYRVAEVCLAAVRVHWPAPSPEWEFAADVHHTAMQDLFFAGGNEDDIEREQKTAGTWAEGVAIMTVPTSPPTQADAIDDLEAALAVVKALQHEREAKRRWFATKTLPAGYKSWTDVSQTAPPLLRAWGEAEDTTNAALAALGEVEA